MGHFNSLLSIPIFLTALLISISSNAKQAQLQTIDDKLLFIANDKTYQFSGSIFSLKRKNISYNPIQAYHLTGKEFIRNTNTTKIQFDLIEEKCHFKKNEWSKTYVKGNLRCNFFGKMQQLEVELSHNEIQYRNEPYISYDNYKKDNNYYISLTVDEHLYAHSIAHVIFSPHKPPTLITVPVDCNSGFSDTIYTRDQQLFCYEITKGSWITFINNKAITLPAPCNTPQQLMVHNNKLWGLQKDIQEQYHLCQYNRSLSKLNKRYFYGIDIAETLQAVGLPPLTIDSIVPNHQEIDNGQLVSYEFILASPVRIKEGVQGTVLIDDYAVATNSKPLQLNYVQQPSKFQIQEKLVTSFEILSSNAVFQMSLIELSSSIQNDESLDSHF